MSDTSENRALTSSAETRTMRDRFEALLKGYLSFTDDTPSPDEPLDADIPVFLKQFAKLHERAEAAEQRRAASEQKLFRALLSGYNDAEESYRRRQEACADDFNLLEVMQLTGSEIRYSMVLAWLLHRDLHKGTHAQGNLGFRLFLKAFDLPPRYADCKYWVRREVAAADPTRTQTTDRMKIYGPDVLKNVTWQS